MSVESYNGFAALAKTLRSLRFILILFLYRNERKVFARNAKVSQLGLYKRTILHHTFENGEAA